MLFTLFYSHFFLHFKHQLAFKQKEKSFQTSKSVCFFIWQILFRWRELIKNACRCSFWLKHSPVSFERAPYHITYPPYTQWFPLFASVLAALRKHSTHRMGLVIANLHFSDAPKFLFNTAIINLDGEISSKIYFSTNLKTPKITQCLYKYRFRIWTSYYDVCACVGLEMSMRRERKRHTNDSMQVI